MIDKNDPKLTAYAMGELSAEEAREVEQSIAVSPELATAVAEIRAMIGSLESAFADEPPLELALSDQQRLAIESAAQAGSKETDEEVASVTRAAKDTAATSARPWGRWLLAAAIGTVLIGGGVFLANSNVQRVRHAVVNETFSSKPAGAKTAMDSAQVAGDLLGRDLDDDSMPEEEFEPMLDLVQSTVDLGGVSGNMAGESAPLPAEETDVELALEENELRLAKALEISRNRARSSAHEMAMREDRFSRSKELMGEGNEPMSQPFYDFSLSGEGQGQGEQADGIWVDVNGRGGGGMGGGQPGGQADGMHLHASSGSGSRSAPMAASPQRVSGMPGGADMNERLTGAMGDYIEFPDASEWLAKKRFRARFDDSKSLAGRGQNMAGEGKRPAEFIAGGEVPISTERLAKLNRAKKLGEANESRKAGDGEERDEEEEKYGKDRLARLAKPKSAKKKNKKEVAKTWKRVKAIPNTTRLMVGDKEELDLTGMQVNVQVDGFRARVLIDYLYYNDRDRQLEGNFKLRLPEDSSLYYFAFGESANELTPQRQLARREFVDNGTRFVSFTPAAVTKSRNDVWRNVKEARMVCLLYTSPSPRDGLLSRMPSSA